VLTSAYIDLLNADRRPVWLLDVDGVLNADYAVDGDWPSQTGRIVTADNRAWPFTWAPGLIRRVKALAANGSVDIVWATTWCPWAEALEALWGLPAFTRAWDRPLFGPDALAAKRDAWKEARLSPRPVIHTDDQAAEDIDDSAAELLGIRPHHSVGLTRTDMGRIERFASIYAPDLSKETR
jgi:hypothetical protein